MQCKEWDDANSELFKESHDEAVHKNSYKSRLYDLISASLASRTEILHFVQNDAPAGRLLCVWRHFDRSAAKWRNLSPL